MINATSLRRTALLVLAIAVAQGEVARAAGCLRPQDEFFVVNTRPSCCTTDAAHLEATLTVEQLVAVDEGRTYRWLPSHFDRLRESPGIGTQTIVYVHGNQITHAQAKQRTLDVYRSLIRCADDRPVRFILWSWPATKIEGFLNDFRVKALRTRPLGWQLAWGLDQLPTDSPVSLMGYSYGARIIGGAAHLLAGGNLGNLALTERVYPNRPAMRVAFLAPATHAHWYGSGAFHGRAFEQIDRLWTTVNPKDPAMRFYSWSDAQSDPAALGFKGPCCLDAERRSRLVCCNVERSVGRSHDLYDYIGSQRRMTSLWQHLTIADTAPLAAAN